MSTLVQTSPPSATVSQTTSGSTVKTIEEDQLRQYFTDIDKARSGNHQHGRKTWQEIADEHAAVVCKKLFDCTVTNTSLLGLGRRLEDNLDTLCNGNYQITRALEPLQKAAFVYQAFRVDPNPDLGLGQTLRNPGYFNQTFLHNLQTLKITTPEAAPVAAPKPEPQAEAPARVEAVVLCTSLQTTPKTAAQPELTVTIHTAPAVAAVEPAVVAVAEPALALVEPDPTVATKEILLRLQNDLIKLYREMTQGSIPTRRIFTETAKTIHEELKDISGELIISTVLEAYPDARFKAPEEPVSLTRLLAQPVSSRSFAVPIGTAPQVLTAAVPAQRQTPTAAAAVLTKPSTALPERGRPSATKGHEQAILEKINAETQEGKTITIGRLREIIHGISGHSAGSETLGRFLDDHQLRNSKVVDGRGHYHQDPTTSPKPKSGSTAKVPHKQGQQPVTIEPNEAMTLHTALAPAPVTPRPEQSEGQTLKENFEQFCEQKGLNTKHAHAVSLWLLTKVLGVEGAFQQIEYWTRRIEANSNSTK